MNAIQSNIRNEILNCSAKRKRWRDNWWVWRRFKNKSGSKGYWCVSVEISVQDIKLQSQITEQNNTFEVRWCHQKESNINSNYWVYTFSRTKVVFLSSSLNAVVTLTIKKRPVFSVFSQKFPYCNFTRSQFLPFLFGDGLGQRTKWSKNISENNLC